MKIKRLKKTIITVLINTSLFDDIALFNYCWALFIIAEVLLSGTNPRIITLPP
jgi:hypothetical protein